MPKEENRPDPDELLEKIQKQNKGKLTVFLGAAAGVGKTYTMLEAAHERLAENKKVVIGWIETHGRVETEKMVEGLPRIAPRILEYRGKELREMDIDAIVLQKPEIVLVDELAHTNIPGARHVRRFQDVEEILNHGINVYTTVNIQHMESLNDVVAQITGVIVRETVPDYILEVADNIQLIDIPPEELIKRLKEGKVYVHGQAERALKQFFRPGNINALRELALRFTATRVDQDLTEYMREHDIEGPWPAAGRVMVCVSASPFSAQLIRAARRLSSGLRAELLAVHIETPNRRFPMGEKERDRVIRNMRLAEELGGKTITVVGENLIQEMLETARIHNVTAIVIGKPRHNRLWEILHGSVVDKLIRKSGGLNVYVIQGSAEKESTGFKSGIKTVLPSAQPVYWHYAGGLLMSVCVTVLSWLFRSQFETVNIALLYFLPVLLTAVWWGRWPSYFTALISVLSYDFLFVPPIFNFTVYDIRYIWSFLIFLLISFFIGGRTELLRAEARAARQREKGTRVLYEFSRGIAAVADLDKIAQKMANHTGETIGRNTVVLLPDKNGRLVIKGAYDPVHNSIISNDSFLLPEAEYAVAIWAFEHSQVAGRSSETLPGAQYLYVPLLTGETVGGVFGVKITEKKITPEERRLIEAWAGLAAIAIERVKLSEQARQASLLVESERLRTALFNSISHELRTPLSAIIGAASTLLDTGVVYSDEIRRELTETIQEGASRMERVVANLLDTARLESGMLRLKNDWCDIIDIVGTALRRLGETAKKYTVKTDIPLGIPLIRADCVLLEQVLVNLIDNAMKYSVHKNTIIVVAALEGDFIKISVLDHGSGIPENELKNIFEKFYRSSQTKQISGTGLGLSICKTIVEAHRGKIWAENRVGGGLVVNFVIPIQGDDVAIPPKVGE
jgi:two-component system sensor histidine kinase KdpD